MAVSDDLRERVVEAVVLGGYPHAATRPPSTPQARSAVTMPCRTNPVGADFGKADLPARFISRSASMALMSEADAGTLSNSNASRKAGDQRRMPA